MIEVLRTRLVLAAAALAAALPSAAHAAIPSGNLLANPGGEQGTGAGNASDAPPLPGWTTTPSFTIVAYGAPNFPTPAESARNGGGSNFLAGGPSNAESMATQIVDISAAAPEIDAGGVHATLEALLGGYSSQADSARAEATFLGAAGQALGVMSIGPVTPLERNSQSVFLPRGTSAAVPAGTRSVDVRVIATRSEGSYNDGYADNVGFALAAGAPPRFASTVDAGTVSGKVLVRLPRAKRFVTLDGRQIPVGSIVDSRRGRVRLTTSNGSGGFQTGEFYEGIFRLTQPRNGRGMVELALVGSLRACRPARRSVAAAKPKSARRLWGAASGKFRTRGRFATATVRGTTWLTNDRCDGTQVRVTEGSVTVRDLVRRRNVTVQTGAQYLARARR